MLNKEIRSVIWLRLFSMFYKFGIKYYVETILSIT